MVALPTLYEYYTDGGVNTGLSAAQSYFTLNDKNITLYSGSLHYFRVPKPYWRDRLRKVRAAGLNTIETYIPWNIHEPEIGNYDFGNGGSDLQEFLDLETFLKIAQEEDLLVIVRPGPFICAEWEFGGLPSWLLREKGLKVRSSVTSFMKHVTRFFNVLLPILAGLQFTLGGPIIALQLENEFGATISGPFHATDKTYLEQLRQLCLNNGIVELLLTSDVTYLYGTAGTLPEHFLLTTDFDRAPGLLFNHLKLFQQNKPVMVMEFWTAWFDHWVEKHRTRNSVDFYSNLKRVLRYPASFNLYMFHGGTNWGFLNGASVYFAVGDSNFAFSPITTSYDFDAPLTEGGDYTDKYYIVKNLIEEYNHVVLKIPDMPETTPKVAYPSIPVIGQLKIDQIEIKLPYQFYYSSPVPMEVLPMNNNSGQSYGYIIYRKTNLDIPAFSVLRIEGHVYDTVMVVINGELVSKPLTKKSDLNDFGYWRMKNGRLFLGRARSNATLLLIVENWGRNNLGFTTHIRQFKGLWQGDVYLNFQKLQNWEALPLEFKSKWTSGLDEWQNAVDFSVGPSMYKALFTVDNPQDTFIDMRRWTKGIVIINGFVLGRYASPLGPQQTLYLPAPLMRNGTNEIVVFEHFAPDKKITFIDKPVYDTLFSKLSMFDVMI